MAAYACGGSFAGYMRWLELSSAARRFACLTFCVIDARSEGGGIECTAERRGRRYSSASVDFILCAARLAAGMCRLSENLRSMRSDNDVGQGRCLRDASSTGRATWRVEMNCRRARRALEHQGLRSSRLASRQCRARRPCPCIAASRKPDGIKLIAALLACYRKGDDER
jgi:hypothetical protein